MKISDLMISPPVTVAPQASVRCAALRMHEESVGSVLVAEDGTLRGVLTDRDIVVRAVVAGLPTETTTVAEVMSDHPVTVDVTDSVDAAYRAFRRSGVRRLPVVDGHRLVGVLTIDDLFLDVFQRFADLLGPVSWSTLQEPPARRYPAVET
ncbi:CBS domain-containing protein [Streptantibioticus rubrisoli]|uniref:CBS domain-containing protein n=1 Tax=Streptantibioticus rubrisoli TaxID=1387313 RepID=A0ABT1PAB4_9ACTN|nr:CBS domain-containing protein [Streptantibioticus rubrisoli]MCQ4042309.1 CBS domain-containing protein [Streptantibioticus rubrisoli]